LTLRKIIKIVATRRRILRLKCIKFDFGWGSAPAEIKFDFAGGVYSAPQPLAGFGGPLHGRGRGWAGEKEMKGSEREGPQLSYC